MFVKLVTSGGVATSVSAGAGLEWSAGLVPSRAKNTPGITSTSGTTSLDALLADLSEVDAWAKSDIRAVAVQLSHSVGIPIDVLELALKRQSCGIKALDEHVVAEQQKIADTFHKLGLIPKRINISDAVRKPGT